MNLKFDSKYFVLQLFINKFIELLKRLKILSI